MTPTPAGKCPICGKSAVEAFKPFCSKRCSTLDLGRWFNESYRVEISEENDEAAALPDKEEAEGES